MGLFDSIGSAVGDIASSVIGGGLSFLGAQSANQANQDIANQQMQFQQNMSNTSYQRAVKDLEAAGLNPMLAYSQGGASTPSGALGWQQQNALGAAVQGAGQFTGSLASARQSSATAQKMSGPDTDLTNANIHVANSQTDLNKTSAAKMVQDISTSQTQALRNLAETKYFDSRIRVSDAEAGRIQADTLSTLQDVARMKRDVPRQEAETAKSQTWWGRNVSPFLRDIPFVNSGAAAVRNLK